MKTLCSTVNILMVPVYNDKFPVDQELTICKLWSMVHNKMILLHENGRGS